MSDTPSVPIWKTEFDKRVEAFSIAIGLDEPKVREILGELGADGNKQISLTILDSDEYLPFGDLRHVFVDGGYTKIAILRAAMPHLRAKTSVDQPAATTGNGDSTANALRDLIASNRLKSDWKDRELLEALDETETEIAKILGKRSRGRPCIIFQKDGSVDVKVSLKLLEIAKRQPTAESHRLDDGRHVIVYCPGIFIARPLDESPFYPGIPLVDGFCAKSGTQWNGVSQRQRIMVRIYATQIETVELSKQAMAEICRVAKGAARSLWAGYSEAEALYEKLEAQDKLPKLKILLSEVKQQPSTGKVDLGV